jgi:hypothetical protein
MTVGDQANADREQPRPFGDVIREQMRERRAALSPPLSPRQREQRDRERHATGDDTSARDGGGGG